MCLNGPQNDYLKCTLSVITKRRTQSNDFSPGDYSSGQEYNCMRNTV